MIGEKFNKWTIIGEAPSRNGSKYWLCQCDCGTIREVNGYDLRHDKSKSCGCLKREVISQIKKNNLINQKFGRLTVLYENGRTPAKMVIWHCKCDCGNECDVRSSDLKSGHTQSCGCLQKDRTSEISQLQKIIGHRFGKLIVLDETIHKEGKEGLYRKCQCDCGNITYVDTRSLMNGHTQSCGCLLTSLGEEKIKNILNNKNIIFEKEKTFETFIFEDTKKKPRFDFYLPNYNVLIEYDGIQHFKQGNGQYDNEEKFKITQEHDKIKNQWCKDNNILLIRIPYTHYEELCLEDLLPETSQFIIKTD